MRGPGPKWRKKCARQEYTMAISLVRSSPRISSHVPHQNACTSSLCCVPPSSFLPANQPSVTTAFARQSLGRQVAIMIPHPAAAIVRAIDVWGLAAKNWTPATSPRVNHESSWAHLPIARSGVSGSGGRNNASMEPPMKRPALIAISMLATLGCLTVPAVSADLDGPYYRQSDVIIERPAPPVVVRERIIERYYEPAPANLLRSQGLRP